MATTIKLTPEVADILRRSTTRGNVLLLPPQQLDRKTYEAVNKYIAAEGGKWKKGTGHVLDSDAGEVLQRILGTGAATKQQQVKQSFYTPREIAMQVAECADVSGHIVLEPSAGHGALASACMKFGAEKVNCMDSDPLSVKALQSKGFSAVEGDFLATVPGIRYSRIVMNPPFTKGQDMKHVLHAVKFLNSNGTLLAILPDVEHPEIAHLKPETVERFPVGAFRKAGTNVATRLIRIHAAA